MAANGFLTTVPARFTISKASFSYPFLSVPFKPVKSQLSGSCCCSSSISFPPVFSVNKKESLLRVSVMAAQQEGNNPALLDEERGEEEEVIRGIGNWDMSENEAVGEESDGVVEAVGDAGEDDGYMEPPEEAKVFVIYNRETDQSRGFGFVTMSTVEEAEKAVEMINSYELNGRQLTVNKAAPRGSQPERPPRVFEPTYRIYAGNLPWSVDGERLEEIFSEHGKVVSARVISDRETGRSRAFGFVLMSSESEMNDAIANLDGQNLDGRAIRVNVAEERQRRVSF